MKNFNEWLSDNNPELASKIIVESACNCPCEGCKEGDCSNCSCENCECEGCGCN